MTRPDHFDATDDPGREALNLEDLEPPEPPRGCVFLVVLAALEVGVLVAILSLN